MPRPNHDVAGWALGGVNDYADREGISRDEAHTELLRIALKEVEILPGCDSPEE